MIELIDVWKGFKNDWVLKGINLKIQENGLFAIVGENGSGKTTLIKIISGLLRPDRGVVKLFGEDLRNNNEYKKRIGVLLHENILYEELTIQENLEFYSKLYGTEEDISEVALRLIEALDLRKYMNFKVRDLSYGLKKRANIVRALVNNPDLILFDEPFAGLDENSRSILKDFMIDLAKRKTIIFTTPINPEFGKIFRIENGTLYTQFND